MWGCLRVIIALQCLSAVKAEDCPSVRVISIGSASDPALAWALFTLGGLPLRFVPANGVNIVALNPPNGRQMPSDLVILNRTYSQSLASTSQMKKDLESLERHAVILVALKGIRDQVFLEPLKAINASLYPAISPEQGYAFIGNKGSAPLAENVGSWVDVEAPVACKRADFAKAEQARLAIRNAGTSPEEVGKAARGFGEDGASAAVHHIQDLTEDKAPVETISQAWRAAIAAGVSSKTAMEEVSRSVLMDVTMRCIAEGMRPAEIGRLVMRTAREIPHMTDELRVNASKAVINEVLVAMLFPLEPEEIVMAALREAEDGILDGVGGVRLEILNEWLHPAIKIDLARSRNRLEEVFTRLKKSRPSLSQQADSPIFSKASAAEMAAITAASRARGASPEEIGARTKKAVLALGAHDRAASRVAAKAAVSVAMNEAQRQSKSAREIGADAQVAARAAGLRGLGHWSWIQERIARTIAVDAAKTGLKPDQVGRAIAEAIASMDDQHGTLIFHQLAAREAAEVVSDMVARQSVSIQEVALATRDAILATGWAPEHPVAIARMAASAAAKAIARKMAKKQAGWQEVAQAASDAARAAWLPPDEVPRVAAESASLEVAKEAVLNRKTGEEVGLAVKATIRAAGVPTSFIPVIASKALASALSDCHQKYLGYRPEDVVDAARVAGAPGALHMAVQQMAMCAAQEAARLHKTPQQASQDVYQAVLGSNEGVGLSPLELADATARAVAKTLLVKSVEGAGSEAPLDVAREVLEVLKVEGFSTSFGAIHAATAAAACAVEVSIARNESGESMGRFASKVAKSTGLKADKAKEIAAVAVCNGIFGQRKADVTLVKHAQAAVAATGLSDKASQIIAQHSGEAAMRQCLDSGDSLETCGAVVHRVVDSSGLPKTDATLLGQQIAARTAAEHAVQSGAAPSSVLRAAEKAQATWAEKSNQIAAQAAAITVARQATERGVSAKEVGLQASKAAGRFAVVVAAEVAKVVAELAMSAHAPRAADLVVETLHAIPGVEDVPHVAAHALAQAAVQQGLDQNREPQELGSLALSAAASVGIHDALEVAKAEAPKGAIFYQRRGALHEVLEKHGLNSSLPVQISAEKFVSRAVPGNPWMHQNEFCRESVKISGILKTLNQLELEDEEEDFMIAAAVANASAHRHLNEPWFTETNGGAVRATLVGKNTHCALRAFRIDSSMATAVETPHLAFVAAAAAASATADRLASWGAPAKTIGQLAFQAVRGAAPLLPIEVAAEVSCEAAAESTGPRSQSPAAVLGALTASGMCPGKKVLPGAGLAAKAAARHCVRDVHSAPVTCGLQTHDAAREVLVACQLGMTHAATALADAALGTAYAEEGLSTAQANWKGPTKAAYAAGLSRMSSAREIHSKMAEDVSYALLARGQSVQDVGALGRAEVTRHGTVDPFWFTRVAKSVVEAVVKRNVVQHNSPDLIAKEVQLAAASLGFTDHQLLIQTAVEAATQQEAVSGASPQKIGEVAKNLALAMAVSPPSGLNSSNKELVSLRSALFWAAKAAAKSTLIQQMKENHGPPSAAQEAVVQALQAVQATGHHLGSQQMAELVGQTVTSVSLKQGETDNLPEILKMAVLALHPDAPDMRVAASAASKVVAENGADKGDHPAVIRKEAEDVLQALPQDVVGPVKSHLAFDAAIKAVANRNHDNPWSSKDLGSLFRKAAVWDPERRPLPGATAAMAERVAREVATALAVSDDVFHAVNKAQFAVESLGLPKASAQRIATKVSAKVRAEDASTKSTSKSSCRNAGEAARRVVMMGLPPGSVDGSAHGSGHAFLSIALPAAVKAAIKTGPSDPEEMATCARSAASGAIGKDAKTALQGQWITEAANLAASKAARAAVSEGQLPFQVTAQAEKASAALRSSSPETHHSDGMEAAKAILQHGLEVSADHSETARLARVAAESSGLRIEEARHQVGEQLSAMMADQEADLMSLDPVSSQGIAETARRGAEAAGCEQAESAWIASNAAAEAIAKTASSRGAAPEVVAQLALAAATAAGVSHNEAQRISAWSAAKSSSNQALMLGDSVAQTGRTALRAAHAAGLSGGTATRLAAEAAAKAVLQEASDSSDSYSHMAGKCKNAALAAGLHDSEASLLAASLACPKAAEAAATMQKSPHEIGLATRGAAKASGVGELQGAEEAGVAAASAAVQSALSDGGLHPAKVASLAQQAWNGAGANGTTVAPCIAATAVLKRLASRHHAVPEELAEAAQAMAAGGSKAAKQQVASILAKAVAESAARRGGREDEVARNVLKSLRDSNAGLSEAKLKEMTAMAASTALAKAAVQQGREPAVVSAIAAKAANASGMPKKDAKDMACVAAAAAIAKHSKHVRQGASTVADLVLKAARAAGCGDRTPLAAAITAASRSAAKASLALHGTSAASMARAAWRAATEVIEHVGHGGSAEEKSLWAQLVSIEAVNDWQAQAFVAGLEGHAAEGRAKIEQAISDVYHQEQESPNWMSAISFSSWLSMFALLCIVGLCYWSRVHTKVGNVISTLTGQTDACGSRTVQKFCCAPADEEALMAPNPPLNDFQSLEDDDEPIRHNTAAYAAWFDGEDRFALPEKLVVILERAALEKGRELVGSRAKTPRPDHELQFTFDALETLLESELNQAGRLIVYLHSSEDVIVEVHPGLCMPSNLQRFAKMVTTVLRKRRFTGSTPEAPAVLRVVDGPWDEILPKSAAWYAFSPQGETVNLKEFVRDLAGAPGFGCLPPSSSSDLVDRRGHRNPDDGVQHLIFSIGASSGDATKDPMFRGNSRQRLSICPWDLTGAACCRMLCSEFESLWDVRHC